MSLGALSHLTDSCQLMVDGQPGRYRVRPPDQYRCRDEEMGRNPRKANPLTRTPYEKVSRAGVRRQGLSGTQQESRGSHTPYQDSERQSLGLLGVFRGLSKKFGRRCSRNARPDDVTLTSVRAFTRSFVISPRSLACSQTGSLGHDVRQASITSS